MSSLPDVFRRGVDVWEHSPALTADSDGRARIMSWGYMITSIFTLFAYFVFQTVVRFASLYLLKRPLEAPDRN